MRAIRFGPRCIESDADADADDALRARRPSVARRVRRENRRLSHRVERVTKLAPRREATRARLTKERYIIYFKSETERTTFGTSYANEFGQQRLWRRVALQQTEAITINDDDDDNQRLTGTTLPSTSSV